jgi:hypothetical protein
MSKQQTAWECDCGAVAYGKLPPEECNKCSASDSFVEIDEDELDATAESYLMGEIRGSDWGEEEDSW